jgi:K+/H+ antiporter YhaU regulatory subunit KhtT
MNLRKDYNTTILAINRSEEVYPNPDPEMQFQHGDILIVFGATENLNACRDLFGCW